MSHTTFTNPTETATRFAPRWVGRILTQCWWGAQPHRRRWAEPADRYGPLAPVRVWEYGQQWLPGLVVHASRGMAKACLRAPDGAIHDAAVPARFVARRHDPVDIAQREQEHARRVLATHRPDYAGTCAPCTLGGHRPWFPCRYVHAAQDRLDGRARPTGGDIADAIAVATAHADVDGACRTCGGFAYHCWNSNPELHHAWQVLTERARQILEVLP